MFGKRIRIGSPLLCWSHSSNTVLSRKHNEMTKIFQCLCSFCMGIQSLTPSQNVGNSTLHELSWFCLWTEITKKNTLAEITWISIKAHITSMSNTIIFLYNTWEGQLILQFIILRTSPYISIDDHFVTYVE